MKLHHATMALALIGGLGVAAAQTSSPPGGTIAHPDTAGPAAPLVITPPASLQPGQPLVLTETQKTVIRTAVGNDKGKVKLSESFQPAIGASVPPSIELYMLPDAALAEVPDAKLFKYTVVQDQVVLVDPTTMRVVDIIR